MTARHLMAAGLIAMTLGGDRPATAADYDPSPDNWNGIGYLLSTAREAKVDIEVLDTLDLSALRADDVLMWLYPVAPTPTEDLLRFMGDGGQLIIADDYGGGGPLFGALGVARRADGPSQHQRWHDNEDGFPIVKRPHGTLGEHFLFFNVQEIVANHPAALAIQETAHAIASYDGGQEHLVVETGVGAGRALVIGDPSIFLNQMLRRFYGNKQFAANVMRLYACEEEPCALKLVLPTTLIEGHYEGGWGQLGPLPRMVERAVETIDDALDAVSVGLSAPPWSILLAIVLGGVAALVAQLRFARWRRPVRRPRLKAGQTTPSWTFAEAKGLAALRNDADFFTLATTLITQAEHYYTGHDLDGIAQGRIAAPAGHADPEALREMRHALLRVKRDTASLRSRQPPVISAERFLRLFEDVEILARYALAAGSRAGRGRSTHDRLG